MKCVLHIFSLPLKVTVAQRHFFKKYEMCNSTFSKSTKHKS